MSRSRLFTLDLLGPLIDDQGTLEHALRVALASRGTVVSRAELLSWRGAATSEVAEHFTGDVSPSSTLQALHTYLQHAAPRLIGAPEAPAVLQQLRRQGQRTALLTPFEPATTSMLLRQLAWSRSLFDAVISCHHVKRGPPAPFQIFRALETTGTVDLGQVIHVAGSTRSLQAAERARVSRVLFRGAPDPEVAPDRILERLQSLLDEVLAP